MILLNWILIFEFLLLFCAYIAWWAGKLAARDRPDDALYQFTLVFWRTFRQKPLPLRAPVLDTEEGEGEYVDDADISSFSGNESDEEAPSARRGSTDSPDAPVIRQSTLNVRVIPNSPRDQIAGLEGHTLRIHVMADADAGAANKAVIDLLISTLGIKTHQVLLVRGHFQSQKTFQISGLDQDTLDRKLAAFE
ncbi:MAG TPA: DUF167 domain-containing protein [Tepidisphaeraceae bacterium]|jgi:uncharacterized protein YggU (UPF0235/DUF167 family)